MPINKHRWTKAGGGSGSGASGDVTGPASSTDNAIARYDGAGGKTLQDSAVTVSDLAAGAVTLATTAGNALTIKNTDPAAAAGASVAGDALALTAGNAVASTDTAGAAAGGAVTITAGNAARLTSGNANGGNIVLVGGTGIGTGTAGQVIIPNGATTVPSLAFTGSTNTGFNKGGAVNGIEFCENGTSVGLITAAQLGVVSSKFIGWYASNVTQPLDTAVARNAAGVIRATDGSTGIRGFLGGGAAVASAAAMPVPTGRVFHVTGTTNITSITSTNFQAGAVITLIFDDVLTFTDGNNLKLAGNFVTSADDTITLVYDGTNWFETSRSVN